MFDGKTPQAHRLLQLQLRAGDAKDAGEQAGESSNVFDKQQELQGRVEEARGRWDALYKEARDQWILYCKDVLDIPEGFLPGPSESAPRIDFDFNDYTWGGE